MKVVILKTMEPFRFIPEIMYYDKTLHITFLNKYLSVMFK